MTKIYCNVIETDSSQQCNTSQAAGHLRPAANQHVCELIHAYLQLGLHALEGNHCRAWNLGPNHSATVEEILNEVSKTGLKPKITYSKISFPETETLLLDVQETKDILGWESQISWKKSVSWTLEEYAMSQSSSFSSWWLSSAFGSFSTSN